MHSSIIRASLWKKCKPRVSHRIVRSVAFFVYSKNLNSWFAFANVWRCTGQFEVYPRIEWLYIPKRRSFNKNRIKSNQTTKCIVGYSIELWLDPKESTQIKQQIYLWIFNEFGWIDCAKWNHRSTGIVLLAGTMPNFELSKHETSYRRSTYHRQFAIVFGLVWHHNQIKVKCFVVFFKKIHSIKFFQINSVQRKNFCYSMWLEIEMQSICSK